ncbi:MAG: hypothetical protein NTZ26_01705 [Candidatus Aminicenantes bacterium]|nr:hypothetical protein [Candidatus Aminicenantes bacterium]
MKFGTRVLTFFVAAILALSGQGQAASPPAEDLHHAPPARFLKTEPLALRVESEARLEWLMVFWKTPNAEDYESLILESKDGRTYEGRLDTAALAGPSLAYYLAYKLGEKILYLPEGAPSAVFTVTDATPAGAVVAPTAPAPPSQGAGAANPFPLHLDGSAESLIVREGEGATPSGFNQAHHLRLEYGYRKEGLALDLGARLAYANQPVAGEDPFDLPDLSFSATVKNHSFRMGDLNLSESEFTIASFGRRGLAYGFEGKTFAFRVFTSATQQARGFKGLGWPKSGASLVGGTAGLTLAKALSVKAVFVSGEDDPALGVNVGTSSLFHRRKGQVLAFIGESRLLGESLDLQAEFAAGRYDANLEDGESLTPGQAYRLRGTFHKGALDVQAGYRSIDKDFNTVGQPFLQNDRRGFDASAGLAVGPVRVGGSFRSEETNVDSDPDLATASLNQGRADVSLQIGASSSIRVGYVSEKQDARFATGAWNPYPAFEGTLEKTGLSAGLDLGLASWLRVSASGEKADLRCPLTPAMQGSQTSAMAGLQILIPDRLTLFPILSYSRVDQTGAGVETTSLFASLNGDLTIIRRWLSWNVTGSAGDSRMGAGGTVKSISADTGLNLNLRPLIRLGDAIVSLRAQYIRTQMSGQTTEAWRAAVRLTYSF